MGSFGIVAKVHIHHDMESAKIRAKYWLTAHEPGRPDPMWFDSDTCQNALYAETYRPLTRSCLIVERDPYAS